MIKMMENELCLNKDVKFRNVVSPKKLMWFFSFVAVAAVVVVVVHSLSGHFFHFPINEPCLDQQPMKKIIKDSRRVKVYKNLVLL